MIAEIIKQWEENKHILKEYFKNTSQTEYDSYEVIVKKVFELCIPNAYRRVGWCLDKMTVIDDGDYQGTQIFIIPADTYQPNLEDYVMTDTYYGSCSGCDTLQGICDYEYGLPTEEQVAQYMTLALHLVQKIRRLG